MGFLRVFKHSDFFFLADSKARDLSTSLPLKEGIAMRVGLTGKPEIFLSTA